MNLLSVVCMFCPNEFILLLSTVSFWSVERSREKWWFCCSLFQNTCLLSWLSGIWFCIFLYISQDNPENSFHPDLFNRGVYNVTIMFIRKYFCNAWHNTIVMLNDFLKVSFSHIGTCFKNWLFTQSKELFILTWRVTILMFCEFSILYRNFIAYLSCYLYR